MKTFLRNHRTLTRALLPVVALVAIIALVAGVLVALGATGRLPDRATTAVQTAAATDVALPTVPTGPAPTSTSSASSRTASAPPPTDVAAVAAGNPLPRTADPSAYAVAYATALFSYDTRSQSEGAWTAALTAGLDPTADVHPDNMADLSDRTPPAAVWATMTSSAQRATFAVKAAWVPKLWTQNASSYPTGAAAITVTGTQQVKWSGGASSVPQTVTLLLLCPPFNGSCVVNRIAAQVLQ